MRRAGPDFGADARGADVQLTSERERCRVLRGTLRQGFRGTIGSGIARKPQIRDYEGIAGRGQPQNRKFVRNDEVGAARLTNGRSARES